MISSYELDHELVPECSRFMQVDTIADDISQSRLHEAGQRGQAAGRTAEAIPLLERTLADCERVLGPDHPNTLTSRNNLAMAYQDAVRTRRG
jgi:hypothetical protein